MYIYVGGEDGLINPYYLQLLFFLGNKDFLGWVVWTRICRIRMIEKDWMAVFLGVEIDHPGLVFWCHHTCVTLLRTTPAYHPIFSTGFTHGYSIRVQPFRGLLNPLLFRYPAFKTYWHVTIKRRWNYEVFEAGLVVRCFYCETVLGNDLLRMLFYWVLLRVLAQRREGRKRHKEK